MTLAIREATPADYAALRELFLASRRATFVWQDGSVFELADFDRSCEGEAIWLAETEHGIVGFISCWLPEHFVHSLFVQPGFGRRGVGRALLRHALARMGRPARLKCVVHNENALAFYHSQGWRVESTGMGEHEYYLMQYDEA